MKPRIRTSTVGLVLATCLHLQQAMAITLNLGDPNSIKQAAATAAAGMIALYPGDKAGGIPGLFGDPYYWWEAGGAFNAMINYWYATGDTQYTNITNDAMIHQIGPDDNYMPPNQTKSLGNDDQAFWGFAAMTAAEWGYPDPPKDQSIGWLGLAQGVFNSQIPRWDNATCKGGLRWQIFVFNNGYDYKNTISNGALFHLAARLGRYTGNQTYLNWADKAYDWVHDVGFISNQYHIFDGANVAGNCNVINHLEWSYNAGVFLSGAAYMWNATEDAKWKTIVDGILAAASTTFFAQPGSNHPPNTMFEVACEDAGKCNVDQHSFKAYLSRWLAVTSMLAPWTAPIIKPLLQTSATGAASSCTGQGGTTCGMKWTQGSWDGSTGVGEQMSALEVFNSLLIPTKAPPLSADKGGKSVGDPSAGTGGDREATKDAQTFKGEITTGSRAGAGFLTALLVVGSMGTAGWMMK